MAPPPKYVITRKLIGHYFKKHLPKSPIIPTEDEVKLFECWAKFGIEHPNCEEFMAYYQRATEKASNFKHRLEVLNLRGQVFSLLSKPTYKSMRKGRFVEKKVDPRRNLFDGLF